MAGQEYSETQALTQILTAIRTRFPTVAQQIQTTIDEGKDVRITEPTPSRKASRVYRRKEPFSDQEALDLVWEVLRAYFLELPLFVKSAVQDFQQVAINVSDPRSAEDVSAVQSVGEEKVLEVAGETETQKTEIRSEPPARAVTLTPVTDDAISAQRARLTRLAELIRFDD